MEIAVYGGTGTLGREVVALAREHGHGVRSVSRHGGGDGPPRHAVDFAALAPTPRGSARSADARLDARGALGAALEGSDTVIDAVNGGDRVLVAGMREALDLERLLGVAHHLTISIVGCDRVPLAYYRTKVRQEEALAAGPVPWSVLRATQFHTLVDSALAAAARVGLAPTGSIPLQPIDPAEVAVRLVAAAEAGPAGRLPDIGGPRQQSVAELSAQWRRVHGRRLLPVPVPTTGRLGSALRSYGLCLDGPEGAAGRDFGAWLVSRADAEA